MCVFKKSGILAFSFFLVTKPLLQLPVSPPGAHGIVGLLIFATSTLCPGVCSQLRRGVWHSPAQICSWARSSASSQCHGGLGAAPTPFGEIL